MLPNHHITNRCSLAKSKANGQFDVV